MANRVPNASGVHLIRPGPIRCAVPEASFRAPPHDAARTGPSCSPASGAGRRRRPRRDFSPASRSLVTLPCRQSWTRKPLGQVEPLPGGAPPGTYLAGILRPSGRDRDPALAEHVSVPREDEVVVVPVRAEELLPHLLALVLDLEDVPQRLIDVDDRVVVSVLGETSQDALVADFDDDPFKLDGAVLPVDELPHHPEGFTATDACRRIRGPQRCIAGAEMQRTAAAPRLSAPRPDPRGISIWREARGGEDGPGRGRDTHGPSGDHGPGSAGLPGARNLRHPRQGTGRHATSRPDARREHGADLLAQAAVQAPGFVESE